MTTTGDLSTPTHLRALVAALPEHQRQPWEYRATSVYMEGRSRGSVVAIPHAGPSPIPAVDGAVGELVATVASPPVVLALADLLAELHETDTMFMPPPVRAARDALEAAIHRTPEGAA